MNARFYLFFSFFLFFYNIGQLPYGVLGTAPKLGLREEIELVFCVYDLQKTSQKEFNVGFVQVLKKKRAARAKYVVFIYLLDSFRSTFSLPSPPRSPSSLLPGFIDVRKRLGIQAHF